MSHRKSLVRLVSALVVALIATLGFAGTASAASPHYVKGPDATVVGNSLIVTFKAAGLGNTVTSADFSLVGTVEVTSQCYTKSGNPVNGVPKSEEITVNQNEPFPVRNGQVTGMFEISPLSTLTCTGKQVVRIESISYDLWLYGDGLPAIHLMS